MNPIDTIWIDLTAPTPAQVSRIATLLDLHPLIAEDIVEGNQRSKIEATDGLVHIVLFALEYAEEVRSHEIDLETVAEHHQICDAAYHAALLRNR